MKEAEVLNIHCPATCAIILMTVVVALWLGGHLYSLYPAVTDDGKCWNNEWTRLAVSARNKSRVKKPVQKSGRIKRQKGKCCSQSSGMWNGRHYFFDLVPLWRIFWFLMTCLGRGFIPVLNGCTPSTASRGFRVSFITSVFLAGERGHWG